MIPHMSSRMHKAVLVLAFSSWLIAIVQFIVETLRSHQTSPYLAIRRYGMLFTHLSIQILLGARVGVSGDHAFL